MTVYGALLFTGGESRRMGMSKARVIVESDDTAAERLARVLRSRCDPCLELGPATAGITYLGDEISGAGPVTPLLRGLQLLLTTTTVDSVVLLGCDLVTFREATLAWLLGIAGETSLLPVIDGRPNYFASVLSREGVESLMMSFERRRTMPATVGGVFDEVEDLVRYSLEGESTFLREVRAQLRDVDTPEEFLAATGRAPRLTNVEGEDSLDGTRHVT